MSYISYNKLWESEFDGIVPKRDKLQDLNINQLKLEVHDAYKKREKTTTNLKLLMIKCSKQSLPRREVEQDRWTYLLH